MQLNTAEDKPSSGDQGSSIMDFGEKIIEIAVAYWDIMLASSVFILFGFLVAGLLKGFLPADFIERHLGKKSRTGILKAAVFGVPIPL